MCCAPHWDTLPASGPSTSRDSTMALSGHWLSALVCLFLTQSGHSWPGGPYQEPLCRAASDSISGARRVESSSLQFSGAVTALHASI
jgi:hypothetical protein